MKEQVNSVTCSDVAVAYNDVPGMIQMNPICVWAPLWCMDEEL